MSANIVVINGVETELNDARLNPVSKTPQMTAPVGVDGSGKLFAAPSSSEEVGAFVNEWLDEHPEATTTVQDGSITKAKLNQSLIEELSVFGREDISKYATGGVLDDSNFADAFEDAHAVSKYLYIPSGDYDFDTIGKILVVNDVDILCADDAVFSRTTGTDWMFDFRQCNVKWNGGQFESGSDGSASLLYNSDVNGYNGGAIYVKECKSAEFVNLKSNYSNLPAVIVSENSDNVNIHNCKFYKSVLYAVHFLRSGKNLRVTDCVFDTIYVPDNIGDSMYYCYAVATGLRNLSDKDGDNPWTPPENLIYSRNIVKNSGDSGLDTHGARNVEISNNIILNCNTCITAYNDSRRVTRPTGWKMSNVKIVNNVCISNYVNTFGEHSYIMISSSNENERESENWLIENNVFETPNFSLSDKSILAISRLENVVVKNNRFKSTSPETMHGISVTRATNVEIINNIIEDVLGDSAITVGRGSNVIAKNNVFRNCKYNITQAQSTYSYIDGDDSLQNIHRTVKGGVVFHEPFGSGDVKVSKSFGIALNAAQDGAVLNATFDDTDNTIEFASETYLVVGQRIEVDDGESHIAYISKILSDTKMVIFSSYTFASGNVTVTPKAATIVTLGGA